MDSRKYNSQDITSKLDEIKEAIEAGGLAPSVIADAYSDEETYSVGDYVTYDAKSYRCTTAVTEAEEFDPEKWDEVKVLDELASAVELPPVTSTDNGKILSVVEGAWSKADETKELPTVTSSDNGKILFVSEAQWTKYLPYVKGYNTSSDPAVYSFTLSTSNINSLVDNPTTILKFQKDEQTTWIFRRVDESLYYINFEKYDSGIIYRYFQLSTDRRVTNVITEVTVSSGSSQSNVMMVTLTKPSSMWELDKTGVEIRSAIESGVNVYIKIDSNISPLSKGDIFTYVGGRNLSDSEYYLYFSNTRVTSSGSKLTIKQISINPVNSTLTNVEVMKYEHTVSS